MGEDAVRLGTAQTTLGLVHARVSENRSRFGVCGRRESNPHGVSPLRTLSPVRLPVPPRPRRRDGVRNPYPWERYPTCCVVMELRRAGVSKVHL